MPSLNLAFLGSSGFFLEPVLSLPHPTLPSTPQQDLGACTWTPTPASTSRWYNPTLNDSFCLLGDKGLGKRPTKALEECWGQLRKELQDGGADGHIFTFPMEKRRAPRNPEQGLLRGSLKQEAGGFLGSAECPALRRHLCSMSPGAGAVLDIEDPAVKGTDWSLPSGSSQSSREIQI